MQFLTAALMLAAAGLGSHSTAPVQAGMKTSSAVTGTSPYTNLVWSDEFNGPLNAPPDPAKWTIKTGTPWNSGLNTYTSRPENVSMNGTGALRLTARKEDYTTPDGITRQYTSGAVMSKNKFTFAYGHIEARIWVPAGRGFWPAFWTLRWPIGGEIDAMEILGQNPATVYWHLRGHEVDGTDYWHGTGHKAAASLADNYHVFGMTWQPDRISYQLDGVEYYSVAPGDVCATCIWGFTDPEWIILNLGVGGTWPLPPDSSTPFPSRMRIDWVRVWQ